MRPLVARRDHEDRVGLVATGQVEEVGAGAEAVVGVVRADLEIARGDDDRAGPENSSPMRARRGAQYVAAGWTSAHRRDARPIARHVLDERARYRRTVVARPDPMLRDGILLGNVGFGYFRDVLVHVVNLQPAHGVRNRLPSMDITMTREGSVAVLTWNEGENRINLDSLGRLNELLDELEAVEGPLVDRPHRFGQVLLQWTRPRAIRQPARRVRRDVAPIGADHRSTAGLPGLHRGRAQRTRVRGRSAHLAAPSTIASCVKTAATGA